MTRGKKPFKATARTRVVGAPCSELEERVVLAAFRKAGYQTKGEAAREILLAWSLGRLVPALDQDGQVEPVKPEPVGAVEAAT